MKTSFLWSLFERLIGRASPQKDVSVGEVVLTLVWLTLLVVIILVYWPDGGAFIYQGF